MRCGSSDASAYHASCLLLVVGTASAVHFLASDLTHAIVKRGCRDADIIDLSDRFDYVDDTSDSSLDAWH